MLSVNRDSFNSFFPIFVSFISFSSLVAMAIIASTMLNRGGEGRHFTSFPVLGENVQNFTIKHDVGYMSSIGLFYQIEG